jgi:hypothetical protein
MSRRGESVNKFFCFFAPKAAMPSSNKK